MTRHLKFVMRPKCFFDCMKKIFAQNQLYILSPVLKSSVHWKKITDLDSFYEEFTAGQIKSFYLCKETEEYEDLGKR